MKKSFYIISVLLTMVSTVFAQNALTVSGSPVQIPSGGAGNLIIYFQFDEADLYAAYSFDVALPEGISVADTKTYTLGDCHVDHGMTINYKADEKVYSFASLSQNSEVLKGTSGMLISVPIKADASLTSGTVLNAKIQNIVFGTKRAVYVPVENDVDFEIEISDKWILDENSPAPPVASGKAVNVEVKRTVKAGQWSTIVLPFTMPQTDVKRVFGDDVEIATWDTWEVTDYDDDLNVYAVVLKFKTPSAVQLKQGFKAGIIYLFKSVNDVKSFTVEGVEITSTSVEASQIKESGDWESTGYARGTYVATKVPAQGLFINSNKFWYSTGKTNIKGFRAWFDLGEVVSASYNTGSDARINITIDGEATSVDGIPSYQHAVEGVYDLSGRKIQLKDGDLNNLQKGVYIIDGKKVTIK